MKPKRLIVVLSVLIALTSCGAARMHPGSVNQFDSNTYDTLMVAQEALAEARTSIESGDLPEAMKGPYNAAVDAYNLTRESWLLYRKIAGIESTPLGELETALNDLAQRSSNLTRSIRLLLDSIGGGA
jgi:predicted lipoprotein